MLYLSIREIKNKPKLVFKLGEKQKSYALTEKALVAAGGDLFEAGVEQWMCSSSLDHADDYGVDLDVRSLLEDGFRAAMKKKTAPLHSMVEKMFRHCNKPEFLKTLTEEEKSAFARSRKKAGKNAVGG